MKLNDNVVNTSTYKGFNDDYIIKGNDCGYNPVIIVEQVSKPYENELNEDILIISIGLIVGGENNPGIMSLNYEVITLDRVELLINNIVTLCVALCPEQVTEDI